MGGEKKESRIDELKHAQKVTQTLYEIANSVNTSTSLDALYKAIHDSLKRVIGNLVEITDKMKEAELVRVVDEFKKTLQQTNSMLLEIDAAMMKSRGDVGYSVEAMKESMEYLNQFSRMISEDPSILLRGVRPGNIPDFELEKVK